MYSPKTLEALNNMFLAQHSCAVVANNVNLTVTDHTPITTEDFENTVQLVVATSNELWANAVLAMSITVAIPPLTGGAYPPVINGFDVVTEPVKAACWLLLNDAEQWQILTKHLEILQQKHFLGNAAALTQLAHSTKYADLGWMYSNIAARALFDSMDEV